MPAPAPDSSPIERIEYELDGFHQSLAVYRQQVTSWYAQALDKASHAADLPSLLGLERVLRVGDSQVSVSMSDTDFASSVAVCPAGGELKIESQFESVYDVPLGNLQVQVIGLDDGSSTLIQLDAQGKGTHHCTAGGRYQVRVQGGVTAAQVEALFTSYDGLTAELQAWLRKEWRGFKPHWQASASSAIGSGILAGTWSAISQVWDSLSLVQDILKDPAKHIERLGTQAAELAALAREAPQVMEQAMLLASDEAALYLMLRTAMI
ncbi:type IV secretion protein Rhs, partial [Pseudomonas gessardii]|nr:type IV secretion protein Rhs [Pseudomonas gessardii]MCF5111005.1 type IV secretion protein Rhs [Pseudomonas gessardii]